MSLRPAGPEDTPFLLQVYGSVREGELAATDWTDSQKAQFVEMQFAARSLHYREHYPDTSVDVTSSIGLPVGRLYVARWSDEIRIVDIALLPASCNRGLGTTLVRVLQAEAAASGKPLRIHVERFNPALRLYERLGFTPIADRGVYLFMEWRGQGFCLLVITDPVPATARPAGRRGFARKYSKQPTLFSAGFRHCQGPANLPRKVVRNFRMPGDRFNSAGGRVDPKRMRPAFSLEVAAVAPKMLQQAASFHLTITVSRSASGGTPRKPSSRRSARISAIASARLSRASSLVRPWPFAPGISGE